MASPGGESLVYEVHQRVERLAGGYGVVYAHSDERATESKVNMSGQRMTRRRSEDARIS